MIPKLWYHQELAIERARTLGFVGLFFDVGTGKTRTAIEIARERFKKEDRLLKTLIICPPIVIKNWKKEWGYYSQVSPHEINCLIGSGKKRLKSFQESKAHIQILNFESLLMPELFEALKKWQCDILVIDESHRIKNPSAKRSKRVEELANPRPRGKTKAPFKMCLTGTPVLNTPLDLFMQYLVLDGGATFGTSFYAFRGLYCVDRNSFMKYTGRPHFPAWEMKTLEQDGFDAVGIIAKKIANSSVRALKKLCLDLPPFTQKSVYVDMSPDQARLYKDMKNDFIAFLDSKACVAELAITKALRLMQIASGYIKVEGGKEISLGKTPKQEALKELLEDLTPNHKVIVWAVWKENYEQITTICDSLKIPFVEVHGGISQQGKDNAVYLFNSDPSVRVLVGNPGAGGIGINLVASDVSIFYSRNFSLEHSIQAEARNYRGGSEIHKCVTRIDLITENTIDELITEKLLLKEKISENVLKSIRGNL